MGGGGGGEGLYSYKWTLEQVLEGDERHTAYLREKPSRQRQQHVQRP